MEQSRHALRVCICIREVLNSTDRIQSADASSAAFISPSSVNQASALSGNFGSFVHMKSKVQGWSNAPENWRDRVPYYFDEAFNLKIGNFMQHGVFHYVEQSFCEDVIGEYNASH